MAVSVQILGGSMKKYHEAIYMRELAQTLGEAIEAMPKPFEALTQELGLREVSTAELAEVLGLSDRRIAQLWRAGIIPEPSFTGRKCWFPLLASVNAYIDFLREG